MPRSKKPQTLTFNTVLFGEDPEELLTVKIKSNETVATLKEVIWKKKRVLAGIDATKLRLYKVNLSGYTELSLEASKDAIRKLIPAKSLSPAYQLREFFPAGSPEDGNIYIVAVHPDEVQGLIRDQLENQNRDLFQRLIVSVAEVGSWAESDITRNLKGGHKFSPNALVRPDQCKVLFDLEAELAHKRTHLLPLEGPEGFGYHLARPPPGQVSGQVSDQVSNQVPEPVSNQAPDQVPNQISNQVPEQVPDQVSDREFAAFFAVLWYLIGDSTPAKEGESSAAKAHYFAANFMVPPFQSLEATELKYKVEMSWAFPVFVTINGRERSLCKYVPKPDIMVESTRSRCPLVTSEVISIKTKSDRTRMLLQAIAMARAGQYLVNEGEQFFVVAIYLDAQLIAERYIVAQTEPNGIMATQTGPNEKVCICQKNFDLSTTWGALLFLREMFNLVSRLKALEGTFDPFKSHLLAKLLEGAVGLRSLTATTAGKSKKPATKTLEDIHEAGGNDRAGDFSDDSTIFDADDIQTILAEMDYTMGYPLYGHPFVAIVSSVVDDGVVGFLKFVPEGRKETQILQYLSEIKSPRNHTISGVRIRPVHGGQVFLMPEGGSWLVDVENVDAQLWSVAGQLIEAVDFMHQHGVAHLDLKPANILIPKEGGRLSIIDFHTSVRIKGEKTMLRGVVGTPGYIPPEVEARRGQFSALRADLWSCGKTLAELCHLCRPSVDRNVLLEIAATLMDEDPGKRPMMSDVLGRMADYQADGGAGLSDIRFLFAGPPEVSVE